MRALRLTCQLVLVVVGFGGASASADGASSSRPRVELSRDTLELAARAQRRGDAAVIATLSSTERSREERLEATRETPYLHAPEAALPMLVSLASSRDPDLAPAASFAIHAIVDALDRLQLDAHEADVEALASVREGLLRLADDPSKRADLRRLSTFDAALLDELASAR